MDPATSALQREKWMGEHDYLAAATLYKINVIVLEYFQQGKNPYWEIHSESKLEYLDII